MRIADQTVSSQAPDCTSRRWLSIIGIGEDGVEGLSPVARKLIDDAELVVGGRRHLLLAGSIIRGERLPWPSPMEGTYAEIGRRRGRSVAILASGDPFHYGVGSLLASLFPAEEMICIPQPSSFSLAASRMGWALQDTALVSLHGRALERIVRYLQPGTLILALSWDESTPASVARLLAARGMGRSLITVLEALGGPRERIRSAEARSFDLSGIDPLNTIGIEVVADPDAMPIGLAPGLDDSMFESDGQLTKREIRAITLSALSPGRGELLWDIGLGAGSVAIEWLLLHPSLKAIGIEERADRAGRAARNAAALGVPELEIIIGKAPEALSTLKPPDAVFVGGGMSDPGVFEAAWAALRPGGRFVANAISLETEALLLKLFADQGGELIRLQIARAESVGTMSGWRPAMPVTQWRVTKS